MGERGCRHENVAGARFCATCGVALGPPCPRCGAALSGAAAFCTSCGARVSAPGPGAEAHGISARVGSAPRGESRTHPDLELEGERRRVTVMFCDLANSTQIGGHLDPETFSELVDTFYHVCGEAISRRNGFVANYLGDGLLALFGYPEAGETSARDAIATGLDIQATLRDFNSRGGISGEDVSARIGIHSGLVVVTEVGAPERRETHVLGDVVNITARVQAAADAGQIVLTSEVVNRVGAEFTLEALGARPLKGVDAPVALYGVLGTAGAASGAALTSGRFFGRHAELALLSSRWRTALGGEGQTVLVIGEPGIGKSALVQQLRPQIEAEGVWMEVAASRLERTQPFALLKQLLQRQFAWPPEQSVEDRIAEVESSLAQVQDSPDEGVQLVCGLLGIDLSGRYPPLLASPDEARRRLKTWIVRWLKSVASSQPCAAIVEDLQWADPSSLEILLATIDEITTVPCLVLLTARTDFVREWPTSDWHTQISLTRLEPEETREIIRDRMGPVDPADDMIEALVQRSDGVPLFAEELARTVSERVADALGSEIPVSLYDSLMARLDRLGETKATAQVASVIGREFSFDLLRQLSGQEPDDLAAALERLVTADLVRPHGSGSYQFKHTLVQRAAYDSMLRRRRTRLHAQIAMTLASQAEQGEAVAPELLAHHWSEAGDPRHATAAWVTAAQQAAARSAYAEVCADYERALALHGQILDEPEPERIQRELELQLGLTDALQMVRGFGAPETLAAADRARKLGELIGDPRVRMRTLFNLWGSAISSGAVMNSQTLADELLGVAVELADEQSLCEAHIAQASSLYNRSHLAEALEHAHFVTSRPPADLDAVLPASGVIQACLYGGAAATALAFIGEAKGFLAAIDRALHRSDADVLAPVLAPLSSSVIAVWMRDFHVVQRACDELETIGRQLDADILIGWSEIYGGWAQAMAGDAQSGVERTSRGVAKHVAVNQRLGMNHSLGLLAEAQAAAGRTSDALATVADALQLRDLAVQRQHTCELLRIRAVLHDIVGKEELARDDFIAALDMASDMGAALLELRTAVSMAESLFRHGEWTEAHRLLAPILERHHEDSWDIRIGRELLDSLNAQP
jgi:class 3 adenylate cyclase/tetratricopeptide (TPR) repeat protein